MKASGERLEEANEMISSSLIADQSNHNLD
jgi:hypothetical protein